MRKPKAVIRQWLARPLPPDVEESLRRLRGAKDVRRIAVMPDVHLSHGVCIGTVIATTELIYPQAGGRHRLWDGRGGV